MTTYTVANFKGGTTKTTTAAFLAHALAEEHRVLCVDADSPHHSLFNWSDLADEWTIPVIGMPSRDIHVRLPDVARDYDRILIDTPPMEEQAGIVYSALRAADVVVIPVSPTTMEMERLPPIFDALQEIAPLLRTPPLVRVLLTRVDGRANAGKDANDALREAGADVLRTTIPQLQRYAQAFAAPVKLMAGDPYQLAAKDLEADLQDWGAAR